MSDPTLVVIDLQRVFADPGSAWATPGFAGALTACQRLVDRFSPRVVFTRFVAPATPEGAWVDYYRQWPFALQPPGSSLWELELDAGGHPVVDAPTFGKWGPALAAATGDASRIVLCGVSTECCVLSTALAAADAGVRVEVVAGACAGVDEESHAKALELMALYAPLVTVCRTPAS